MLEVDLTDAVEEAFHALRKVVNHSGIVRNAVSICQLLKQHADFVTVFVTVCERRLNSTLLNNYDVKIYC